MSSVETRDAVQCPVTHSTLQQRGINGSQVLAEEYSVRVTFSPQGPWEVHVEAGCMGECDSPAHGGGWLDHLLKEEDRAVDEDKCG